MPNGDETPDEADFVRLEEKVTYLSKTLEKTEKSVAELESMRSRYQAFGIVASIFGVTGALIAAFALNAYNSTKADYTALKKDIEVAEGMLERQKSEFTEHAKKQMDQIINNTDASILREGAKVSLRAVDPNRMFLYHIQGNAYVEDFPAKSDNKDNYRFYIEAPLK